LTGINGAFYSVLTFWITKLADEGFDVVGRVVRGGRILPLPAVFAEAAFVRIVQPESA